MVDDLSARATHSPPHSPMDVFQAATQRRCMYGLSHRQWVQRTQARIHGLNAYTCRGLFPRIFLNHDDPVEFLAGLMAAGVMNCPVFLGNPHWTASEFKQACAIAQPHLLWTPSGDEVSPVKPTQDGLHASSPSEQGWIMIPTGGSSGRIQFAIHTWSSLLAAVDGMQQFFLETETDQRIHSCCVLPLHHVSGLMQWVRSLVTGGLFFRVPFSQMTQGIKNDADLAALFELLPVQSRAFFLSLVPTQLYRLLNLGKSHAAHPGSWLRQFRAILLGGAPASPGLLDQAQALALPLAPTYGMTETAAQVLTLHPANFLAGERAQGEVLPHVQMKLQTGRLAWSGNSLFWGYYPEYRESRCFLTDDLATVEANGMIRILGRESRKIISGGENIYPEEVEQVLMDSQMVQDVVVFGSPVLEWGEEVVAAYVPEGEGITDQLLRGWVKDQLSAYKCPKQWISLPVIPRNAQGKVDLGRLRRQYQDSVDRKPR